MDTQKLKYFIAVAEYLNFSEAATHVGISQSAISQQIAELEKQVGTQLIIRKKRPLLLTSAGKVLLKEAYSLVSKTDEAMNKTYLATKGYVGFLKVGFLGGIERSFLPQAIREFREAYPNIDLSLHQYNWGELNKALVRDEIDVGFTMPFGLERFTELSSKELFSDVISVAMHRSHRLASESSIKISSLRDESFVTLNPKTDFLLYDQTMQLCGECGFSPIKLTLCWDIDVVLFNVESGLGVSILPGTIRDLAGHEVRLIEIDHPNKNFSVNVAWNKSSLNASIPIFVEKLESLRQIKQLNQNSGQ
ncbi:MAG: LysR family transcriptional regulator [Clostridiales bacterium]|nr:LysR family transcriptional regulator [Clostridiales bacterium]